MPLINKLTEKEREYKKSIEYKDVENKDTKDENNILINRQNITIFGVSPLSFIFIFMTFLFFVWIFNPKDLNKNYEAALNTKIKIQEENIKSQQEWYKVVTNAADVMYMEKKTHANNK